MITASPLAAQPAHGDASNCPANPPPTRSSWQQQWREAERDPRRLLRRLDLDSLAARLPEQAMRQFPLRVPESFLARMRPGDRHDPLLRQVLPLDDEDRVHPGFVDDAVGDAAARSASGVLQKYQGRALLIATGSCAVHCRYCFRRHFPYAEETAATARWQSALDQLRLDHGIHEVILSGGDPLSLGNDRLGELVDALQPLAHVRTLRLHSRLPVVLPARVEPGLLTMLANQRLRTVMVIHANHANELDRDTASALQALRESGCILLNQSVLLRGVNDSVRALADLSDALFTQGVLPYYLHQLDRVSGTAHFEVDDSRARQLVDVLRGQLPGYLLPRLVREVAGESSKTPLL